MTGLLYLKTMNEPQVIIPLSEYNSLKNRVERLDANIGRVTDGWAVYYFKDEDGLKGINADIGGKYKAVANGYLERLRKIEDKWWYKWFGKNI